MIFQIKEGTASRLQAQSKWALGELELEKYLIGKSSDETEDAKVQLLDEHIFGEPQPLLLLKHQVPTRLGKRSDIYALDHAGNVVVIELKRDKGKLGVETQALQYLADISAFKGRALISKFSKKEEQIKSFLGANVSIDELNRQSRIILMARAFDRSVFAIGEWLASVGVPFRCIQYTAVEIDKTRLLTFSVAFDRSREPLYPLTFGGSLPRSPQVFWHNIGSKGFKSKENAWWQHLLRIGQISASFDNEPGDSGEALLRDYIHADKIIAYASGHGAVGWGIVENPSYELIKRDKDAVSKSNGKHLHRLSGIVWKDHAKRLEDSVASAIFEKQLGGIYHPVQTKSRVEDDKAARFIDYLESRFGKKP
jgi:hypothetical protein